MGDYKLENTKTAQLRKVYKKTDGDFFIFYDSKFYYGDNDGVKIFIISGNGSWLVSDDITKTSGWMRIEKQGLLTPPRTGWEYADNGTFGHLDQTLKFKF